MVGPLDKTFLVTYTIDHLGRSRTELFHAPNIKAVTQKAKRAKTFFASLRIEEVK